MPNPGDPILCMRCQSPLVWRYVPDDAKRSRATSSSILGAVLLILGILTLVLLIGFIIAPIGLYLLVVGLAGIGANRAALTCERCGLRQ